MYLISCLWASVAVVGDKLCLLTGLVTAPAGERMLGTDVGFLVSRHERCLEMELKIQTPGLTFSFVPRGVGRLQASVSLDVAYEEIDLGAAGMLLVAAAGTVTAWLLLS